jgi:hypothetical protein
MHESRPLSATDIPMISPPPMQAVGGHAPAPQRDDHDGVAPQAREPAAPRLFPGLRAGASGHEPSPEETGAYRELNRMMVAAYPRLAFVLEDPRRFMADMQDRFALQQEATPEWPHEFDVSDWAMPLVADMLAMVREKTAILQETLEGVERRYGSMIGPVVVTRPKRIRKLRTGLRLLEKLERELSARAAPGGTITYRRLLQLTSAVTGPLSLESSRTLSPSERVLLAVDRVMQGFRDVSIDEYTRRFEAGEFVMFERASSVQGFREVEERFVQAVYDRSRLELLGLPVTFDIGVDVLLRLLPYGILPIGITRRVVAADGFARTPEDFKLHDIRHSTSIFSKRDVYDQAHGLTPDASAHLSHRMDVWGLELVEKLRRVEDASLYAAIRMVAFNHHHDRGFPLVPTSYLRETPDHVPYLLYVMLRWSGQSCGFTGMARIREAYRWLRDFFASKLEEEIGFWGPEAQRTLAETLRTRPAPGRV